jgi:hypothetical protein
LKKRLNKTAKNGISIWRDKKTAVTPPGPS